MKKKDLDRALKDLGYWKDGGTKHEKWTNGKHTEMVPRHKEIAEGTAKAILRRAEENK
jgi:mRNA interferase HicA